ncbi:BTAD domain-containing putative transcriptional regulator [Orenia marismortui]|uniref:BTAD domain-containing putative transcriptional regulator n=1 Tax=Orenia marismortui TaxID=46469 RepID=UPI000374DF81|nr:BTAD domain-containing putative transcriptional regulator [Orenia marismortui]
MIDNKLILKSQYILPKIKNKVWKNKKLWLKYSFIKEFPITIIRGRLGTGKTTTLLDYLEKNWDQELYYYSIKEDNVDEINFCLNILECLKYNNSHQREKLNNLIQKFNKEKLSLDRLLKLLNTLIDKEFIDQSIFVIDNFDKVSANENILKLLGKFIEALPASFHLVVVSRKKVPLAKLSYWKVVGKLFEVKEEDFLLNNQEVENFLASTYNLLLSANKLKKLNKWAEGWIAAIDLVARRLKKGEDFEDCFNKNTSKLIFDYFQYDLVDDLEEEAVYNDFLSKTRVLKDLDVRICNQLLEINNSQQLLEELIDKGCFIERIEQGEYRYHNIFHSFLENYFVNSYNEQDLHIKAKDIYLKEDNLEKLIYHSMRLEREEDLVELLQVKEEFFKQKLDFLEKVLEFLSEDIFNKYPILYIYKGDLLFNKGRIKLALKSYQKAENNSVELEERIEIIFRLAKYYIFFTSNKLKGYLDKLDNYKDHFSQSQEKKFLSYKAGYYIYNGKVNKAKEVLKSLDHDHSFHFEAKIHLNAIKGKFIALDTAFLDLEIDDFSCVFLYTYFVPIFYFLSTGEILKAEKYILEGIRSDNLVIKSLKDYFLLNISEFLDFYDLNIVKNKYLSLIEKLDKLSFGIPWFRFQLLYKLSLWEAFYGIIEDGLKYAAKGLKDSFDNNNNLGKCTFLRCMGVNLYFKNDFKKAKIFFKKSINVAKIINSKIHLFYALLWSALSEYKSDNIKVFKDVFQKALKLAKEEGYDNIFLRATLFGVRDPNLLLPLLLAGRKFNLEVDYINQLLEKIDAKGIEESPGYGLKIESFGGLKLYRGREEVKESQWKRKKAKELFELLLVNSNSMIHRNQISSLLWPNKAQEDAENIFYVTLNSLNKVLEPERESDQDSYFIESNGSYYGLNNSFRYSYDVELFEEFISRGRSCKEEIVRISYYQRAIDLYKGDYIRDCLHLDFVNQERDRLKILFLNICSELLLYYCKGDKYRKTIKIADKILDIDNYYEDAYFHKIKSYYKLGLRNFAIETYREYKDIISNELNITIDKRIEDYYKLITN